ncbi:MAG: MG2 domain-containing protein, partial [Chloroflexi bacterium]|nr:MG2 domain-containing protein [Chloroflexota bacterium]
MRHNLIRFLHSRRFVTIATLIVVISLLLPLVLPSSSSALVESKPVKSPMLQTSLTTDTAPLANPSSGTTTGLHLSLSEGAQQTQTVAVLPVASSQPLSQTATAALLDRLPPLTVVITDQQTFKLPEQTLPPPQPGKTVDVAFPPTNTATITTSTAISTGPLQVLRFAPEGEIPVAPFLNVTFNQPMAPLATLEQLSAQDVPVKLTPALPGVWKWLGTKTLSFEVTSDEIDRFPKATHYTVEIPAGTKSATGGVLEKTVTWSFTTPPPVLEYAYPNSSPQRLDPVFLVRFDQGIDAAAVLKTINVTASSKTYAVHLATEQELQADPTVQMLIKNSREGRWIAFHADETFPADTTVTVNIGPGTPSAEGPLTTTQVQSYSFTTYAPLRIDESGCGYGNGDCPPFSQFYIRFNNSLNEEKFDPALIQIEPAIPDVNVELFGNTINIRGATKGRTAYKVTVGGDIEDVFGQKLGQNQILSFKTGPAEAYLSGPSNGLVTLDPSAQKPTFNVYTINYDKLRVRAYAVEPKDWPAYQQYLNSYYTDNPPKPPGHEVLSNIFNVDADPDSLTETAIDLSPALQGTMGHLIVIVDFPTNSLLNKLFGSRDNPAVIAWVQATQIGLDAVVDHSNMVAWATALQDGQPLTGVQLSLLGTNITGVTSPTGTATLALTDAPTPLLVAQKGNDTAILPQGMYGGGGWQKMPISDELRWYVFDDRQMYRPGEAVHVKGWLRRIGGKQNGDVGLLGDKNVAIQYQVQDPQGNQIGDGKTDVNELGGFDLTFTVPTNSNLGYANLNLSALNVNAVDNPQFSHNFQIQEFRRPEFEVSARNEDQGPFFVGDSAVVAVAAKYFAGGPLPNAATTWNVTVSPSSYAPPNWPDFTFGKWIPWWTYNEGAIATDSFDGGGRFRGNGNAGDSTTTYQSKTDASGTHYLRMNFDAIDQPQPYSVFAQATVMDVNRQAWAANTNLLVHPADLYVGIRSAATFVEQGKPLDIEAIVTDLDGKAVVSQTIDLRAVRLEWKYSKGNWQQTEADEQKCSVTSAAEPVTCTFQTAKGGQYKITATITDDKNRKNSSEFTRWVSGGQSKPARNVEQEQVTLIPDKQTYQPGDVAEILVQSPFSPAQGLLTVARNGILYNEHFTITDTTYTLKVPITEAQIPNLSIEVDLNGSAKRLDDNGNVQDNIPARPAYASGTLDLTIPPLSRTLKVAIKPQATALETGTQTTMTVTLTDANGQPVKDGELAAVVVDEAILALTNYQLADPVAAFYSQRPSYLSRYYGRASLVLANPQALVDQVANSAGTMAAQARGGGAESLSAAPAAAPLATESYAAADSAKVTAAPGQAQTPISVRSNFNPLATFAPAVHTDANGQAQISFKLPDNLTRYRVMVVAVADTKYFGSAETNITARLPLMIRPAAPRFLNFGDKFELPIVVQNQTDEPMTVNMAVRSSNLNLSSENVLSETEMITAQGALTGTSSAGQQVTVPANDRVEVRFPATTISAGTARIQIAGVAGAYADAASIELPVFTPATSEAFAVYGTVDEGAVAQPVLAPTNVFTQFGGLEINTSSTAVQALTDAVLYLTAYPFECSEQLASRILGIAALRDVLSAFHAEGLPAPAELEKAVQRDIDRLQGMQNDDGGFPIWERGYESVPYYSIHVAHALQRAKLKGFTVPAEMQQRVLEHLRNIENYYPAWYSETTRQTLSAYALYVRKLMGDVDTAKARNLLNAKPLDQQSLEAVAWLWQVLSDDAASKPEVTAIRQLITNKAVETAGAANFTTSYGDDDYLMLHSNRRTDALILDALINDQPESDLIPKVVAGLLAHRTAGHWNNTQENAFVLLALDRYFNTFEAQTPDFVARLWLGDTYAGEHQYQGRTTERQATAIPMSYLVDPKLGGGQTQNLVISKEGPGRLYYRLGLQYAPNDLNMKALDMGFVVQRTYEAVDQPEDVKQDK